MEHEEKEHETKTNRPEDVLLRRKDVKNVILVGIIAVLFLFAAGQTVDVLEMKTGEDISIFGFGVEGAASASSQAKATGSGGGMVGGC